MRQAQPFAKEELRTQPAVTLSVRPSLSFPLAPSLHSIPPPFPLPRGSRQFLGWQVKGHERSIRRLQGVVEEENQGRQGLTFARMHTHTRHLQCVCEEYTHAHFTTTATATATAATTTFISGARAQGKLRLTAAQDMPTKGAHGWDYFTTTSGDNLLVMPNYYGCGAARGPPPPDASCRSTAVYSWRDGERKAAWGVCVTIASTHTRAHTQTHTLTRARTHTHTSSSSSSLLPPCLLSPPPLPCCSLPFSLPPSLPPHTQGGSRRCRH